MKITMYELLGLVKDGKAPKKIKYNDYEYQYHNKKHGYCRSGYDCTYICLNTDYCLFRILNDEVEILEEEKKIPEKIKDKYCSQISKVKLAQKYNEIIDYLQYLKSKGE